MFQADLAFEDLNSPLDLVDGGILLGSSSVLPFRHRLLRHFVLESSERIAIIACERFADDPEGMERVPGLPDGALQARLDQLEDYDFDFAVLTLHRHARAVRYRASPVVSIPVYLAADAHRVVIDWDYSRVLNERSAKIDWDVALAQIAGLPCYGPRTIVAGLYRATADATLIATPGGIEAELPSPVSHDGPQAVLPDADVEAALVEALGALLEARPLEPGRTALELSGGMDSALTALVAADRLGPGLMSIGAQFAGAMGDAQRGRRALLRRRGGFDDLSIPAERFAPFAPGSLRRVRYGVWPEDENYPEMFEAMFGLLRAAGIDALVSGFGGDELYFAYEGEDAGEQRDEGASVPFLTREGALLAEAGRTIYPRAWLQQSCWQSAASQSQRVLRYGLWPIYPYHNVALARFVSRLPREYRRDRRLLRRTLTRLLGDPIFETDYVKETFDPVARRGVIENRDYLLDLVRRSPLSLHPGVNAPAVLAALERGVETLDRATFGALFRFLKVACFFQDG